MFEKVKKYYDSGLWSEERVRNVMLKGVITYEEYEKIVNEDSEDLRQDA